jgi:hypothetical protein
MTVVLREIEIQTLQAFRRIAQQHGYIVGESTQGMIATNRNGDLMGSVNDKGVGSIKYPDVDE